MYRLTIRKQNNPQESVFHLFNRRPSTDTSILLHCFLHWIIDHPFDPFITNDGAIRPLPNEVEVFGEFHRALYALQPR